MESKLVPTATPLSPHSKQETRGPGFRPIVLLAWFLAGVALVFAGFAPLLHSLNSAGPMPNVNFVPSDEVIAVLFPLVGAFIASRQPGNAVGWILCVMGLSSGISTFSTQYDVYTLFTRPHTLPLGAEVSWLDAWTWIISVGLIPLLLHLFPSGHFLSRRWQWLAWFSSGMSFLAILSTAIPTWNVRGTQLLNAFNSDESKAGIVGIYALVNAVSLTATIVSILFAAICMIVRLYRARGIERQQLKWFTYAVTLFAIDTLVAGIYENYLPRTTLLTTIDNIVAALIIATLPFTMSIAMLRYRLYDIDVLINRTLVYGTLTVLLVLVYFGSVVGLEALLHNFTQNSDPAIVGSTLAIAALFQPLR